MKVAGRTLPALAIVGIPVLSIGLYRIQQQVDYLTNQMPDDQAAPDAIQSGLNGETAIGAQLADQVGLAVVNESARVRVHSNSLIGVGNERPERGGGLWLHLALSSSPLC